VLKAKQKYQQTRQYTPEDTRRLVLVFPAATPSSVRKTHAASGNSTAQKARDSARSPDPNISTNTRCPTFICTAERVVHGAAMLAQQSSGKGEKNKRIVHAGVASPKRRGSTRRAVSETLIISTRASNRDGTVRQRWRAATAVVAAPMRRRHGGAANVAFSAGKRNPHVAPYGAGKQTLPRSTRQANAHRQRSRRHTGTGSATASNAGGGKGQRSNQEGVRSVRVAAKVHQYPRAQASARAAGLACVCA